MTLTRTYFPYEDILNALLVQLASLLEGVDSNEFLRFFSERLKCIKHGIGEVHGHPLVACQHKDENLKKFECSGERRERSYWKKLLIRRMSLIQIIYLGKITNKLSLVYLVLPIA